MNPSRLSLFRPVAALGLVALLSACAVPDLGGRPEMRMPGSIAAERSFAGQGSAEWPGDGWWNGYGDVQLATLIEEGLKGSPDAAAAAARFRVAQGMAQAAGAALRPSLDAGGSVYYERQSRIRGIPPQFVPGGWRDAGQAALSFSFDIDLWGRNRAALAAATSEAEAARIEQNQAQLMLTTAIATSYADLARLHAEGQEGIPLLRAMLRRMALLARLRAEVEQGSTPTAVMASSGKSLFWKEKDDVGRQLARWRAPLLAKAMARLLEAERQVKAAGGIGPLAADEELFAICRQAARLR